MLGVYRDYLLILRNSLIREGVPLKVDDLNDYTDIYYFGEKLNDIIWFYSVLALGNSRCRLRGFFWKLDKKYIEEIKKEIRDEYLEEAKLFNEVSSDGFLERKRRSEGISEVNISNEGYVPSEGADESVKESSEGDEVKPSSNEVKEPSNSEVSDTSSNEVSEKVKLDIVDEDGWLSYKGKVLKGSETPANEGNKGVIFDDEGWGEEEVEDSEDGWVDDFEDDEEEEEDIDFPEMGDDEEDSEDDDFPELDDEDEEESDDDFPEMPDDEDDDDFSELDDEDADFPEMNDEEDDEGDIDFPEMGDDDEDEDVDFPEMDDDEEDDDFPELDDEDVDFPEMSDDDDEDEDVDFPEMSDDDDEEEDVDFPEMEDDDDDVDFPEMEDDDDDVDFPEMDDDDVDFPEMEDDDDESQDTQATTELVGDDFTSTGVLSESQEPQKKKVSFREVQEEAFAKGIESTAEGIVKFASNTFNKFRNGNKEKPAVRRHEENQVKRVKK